MQIQKTSGVDRIDYVDTPGKFYIRGTTGQCRCAAELIAAKLENLKGSAGELVVAWLARRERAARAANTANTES